MKAREWIVIFGLACFVKYLIFPGQNMLTAYLYERQAEKRDLEEEWEDLSVRITRANKVDQYEILHVLNLLVGFSQSEQRSRIINLNTRQSEVDKFRTFLWYQQLSFGYLDLNDTEQKEFCRLAYRVNNPIILFTGIPNDDALSLWATFNKNHSYDLDSGWSIFQGNLPIASEVADKFRVDLEYKGMLVIEPLW